MLRSYEKGNLHFEYLFNYLNHNLIILIILVFVKIPPWNFIDLQVVLETEVTNKPALKLYEKLGFVRDKRLFRYYLNGVDALRLKLWLR